MMLMGLLFLVQASAAPAATPAQSPAPANDDQKMVCRSETVVTSRIAERVCHTKAEWERIARDSEESFKSSMNKHMNPGNSPE